MKFFLFFMFSTVMLILIRCIYRIIELKDGYFGPNFRHQREFIALRARKSFNNTYIKG